MKKSLFMGVLILLISCLALYVFAGNYTSTDPTKNSYYDRTKAANFAVNATSSPYTGMTYVIPNDDCTNFVSHCLKAGGMSTISCSNYYDWNGWTYYNASWENAHYFRYHWGNVNGTGKNRCYSYKVYTIASATSEANWSQIWNDLYQGDVVQYVFGADSPNIANHFVGETGHSQVVHGYKKDVLNINGHIYSDFLMAQHSQDGNNFSLYRYIQSTAPKVWGSQGWVCTYKIKL